MNIEQIAKEIDSKLKKGLQISKRKGLLTSTWVIYKRKNVYYFFDICEKFTFDSNHCYTKDELALEFKDSIFEIDMEVN